MTCATRANVGLAVRAENVRIAIYFAMSSASVFQRVWALNVLSGKTATRPLINAWIPVRVNRPVQEESDVGKVNVSRIIARQPAAPMARSATVSSVFPTAVRVPIVKRANSVVGAHVSIRAQKLAAHWSRVAKMVSAGPIRAAAYRVRMVKPA